MRLASQRSCRPAADTATLAESIRSSVALVFVYGTLKSGYGNHRCLSEFGATFVCDARSLRPDYVLTRGAFPYCLPVEPGDGTRIIGEVYAVSAPCLARLDMLEGYPNHYTRKTIDLEPLYTENPERFGAYSEHKLDKPISVSDVLGKRDILVYIPSYFDNSERSRARFLHGRDPSEVFTSEWSSDYPDIPKRDPVPLDLAVSDLL